MSSCNIQIFVCYQLFRFSFFSLSKLYALSKLLLATLMIGSFYCYRGILNALYGKSFSHRTNLVRHQHNIQEHQIRLPCEVCGLVTSRRDVLRRHIDVVHGNRRAAAPILQTPAPNSSTVPPLCVPPHCSSASDAAIVVIVGNPQYKINIGEFRFNFTDGKTHNNYDNYTVNLQNVFTNLLRSASIFKFHVSF